MAVVNPVQIRDFAKAVGKLASTDRLDAAIIAHFGEAIRPAVCPMEQAEAQALSERAVRWRQVNEMMGAERNRGRRIRQQPIREAIKRDSAFLRQQLSEMDKDIDQAIRQPPMWQAEAEPIDSALYIMALAASRSNRVIAAHYEKLRSTGKTGKQALISCMHKLLVILNAMSRDKTHWRIT